MDGLSDPVWPLRFPLVRASSFKLGLMDLNFFRFELGLEHRSLISFLITGLKVASGC